MQLKHLSKTLAVAAVVLATVTLSSCAWLNGLSGTSIASTWAGTLVDLYEEDEYQVTLDLTQDGDLVSGSATFALVEETLSDVVVDGTRESDGSFIVTLHDVSEDDVTLTGTVTDEGRTFSGTWALVFFENHGTFELTRTD
jgi:hypothetical protein